MSKNNRHSPVISRNCDSSLYEDNWLTQLEKQLNKQGVQSARMDESIFNQISSIMNGTSKSKHTSVEAAVEDMKQRSGLTDYLNKLNKQSSDTDKKDKILTALNKINTYVEDELKKKVYKIADQNIPIVIQKCPSIKNTIENYIKQSRGNLPVAAIIDRVRSIHNSDVSDPRDWEDDNLIIFVSQLNLKEKSNNPDVYKSYTNLGTYDDLTDSNDPSNTDAFYGLNPAKG